MKKILLPLVALLTAPAAIAETEVVTIVDHITSGTSNVINQPEELLKRLLPVEGVEEESKKKSRVRSADAWPDFGYKCLATTTRVPPKMRHAPNNASYHPVFRSIRRMSCTHLLTGD